MSSQNHILGRHRHRHRPSRLLQLRRHRIPYILHPHTIYGPQWDCEPGGGKAISWRDAQPVEQVLYNVRGYLDEFSKAIAIDVCMLLGEVGELHEECRAIQHEVGSLMMVRAEYSPGGEFHGDRQMMGGSPTPDAPPWPHDYRRTPSGGGPPPPTIVERDEGRFSEITPHVPAPPMPEHGMLRPEDAQLIDVLREQRERLNDTERELAQIVHEAHDAEGRRNHEFRLNDEARQ
ncbi:hypothetical protein PISMIDRAFT_349791 [Pisolithus microcarpus 441]|uniref:Uncharacterized protein n=1 Tax=Pisolithus microcarpus 441 TaxID=765257 RepID=A0A0C9ZSW0_9AGAM|nr:hypothetical protein PISMIDRAFT_349791 [Pisolithus microcarpus 441]